MIRFVLLFVFSAVSALISFSQNEFSEGIDAYNKKNYGEAVEKFEQVVSASPNDVSAWYNLGLSNMGLLNYGEAILNFEKVLKYTPNDVEAAEKASYCYSELYNDRIWQPRLNNVESSLYSLSSTIWAIVSIVCSIMLSLVLIFRPKQKHKSLKNAFTLIAVVLAFLTIGSITVSLNAQNYATNSNVAIVTKSSIPTFIEAGKTAKTSLKEGTRVEIIETPKSDFVEVITDQEETCLVRKSDLSII